MPAFTPQPAPASAPGIYAVNGLLSRETWKAAEIVSAGRVPASPLLFESLDSSQPAWEEWVGTVFGARFAPYVILARDVARHGVQELAEQDRQFARDLPPERRQASIAFGITLLEASLGARHMPEVAKFQRLVTAGRCPGLALTVLALRSVLFGVTTVNTLVACLFSEWVGALTGESRPLPDRECLQQAFAAATPSLPHRIASWLQAAGNPAFQSGAASSSG